jgi:hypothetical protein
MRSTGFTVRPIRETEKPIAEVAWDLGINAGTLGNWVNIDWRRPGASQNGCSVTSRRSAFPYSRSLPAPVDLICRCECVSMIAYACAGWDAYSRFTPTPPCFRSHRRVMVLP